MITNDPEIVAEVRALFDRYETALMDNDVATLNALFWNSPHTLRYGVGENLYGHKAIAAFRSSRAGGAPQRALRNTTIQTFGRDYATANTEFIRSGGTRIGRQTQTWERLPEGWRIVAAHVSLLADTS
jgi:hypothetical protein